MWRNNDNNEMIMSKRSNDNDSNEEKWEWRREWREVINDRNEEWWW